MSVPKVELWSERFGASGGIAAQGVKKLLGTPKLSLLQTVLRETVQNTWDARNGSQQIRYLIRLRKLRPAQLAYLADNVFRTLPRSETPSPIAQFLQSPTPIVMEIADWGTRGLAGPTRADLATGDKEPSNFVDFIRNIGIAHPVRPSGGTYGYGKSSVYLASECSTIIVDTLAETARAPERRLIAAHLGEAYEKGRQKFTGRHWWGVPASDSSYVEPLVSERATEFARALDLPERRDQETGTTIMILGAILNNQPAQILGEIQEAILWYFWPKMLDDNGPLQRIHFELEVEGRKASFPSPEHFPPLDLFVEAYRGLRRREDFKPIESARPKERLGNLALRRGFRNDRRQLTDPETSIIPATTSHIAVMRPVELVVRYFEQLPLPNQQQEWAGVFICSNDAEVERAFAAAEPPAHDDWVPAMLPKGPAKTYVNVALREIKLAGNDYAQPPVAAIGGNENQPPLARAADRLGAILPDTNPGVSASRGSKSKKTKRSFSISPPSFVDLEDTGRGVEAIFEVEIGNSSKSGLEVQAVAGAVIDGALSRESTGPDGGRIEIKGWQTQAGAVLSRNEVLKVPATSEATYRVRVSVPPMCAVGLAVEQRRLK